MQTYDAMTGRRSIRGFLNDPISQEQITAILEAARWAPSGVNMQPWRVAVVTGETKHQLADNIIAAREAGEAENPDYHYYPDEWFEPYKGRRKETGLALYGALGIGKEDKEKRIEAWYNNYRFFGAPVGLLVFLNHRLGQGSWIDIGMFIQNIMLAAYDQGLGTCPQASLAEYPDIVRDTLGIDKEWALACGIALGYPDPEAAVNGYRMDRQSVEAFTSWYD